MTADPLPLQHGWYPDPYVPGQIRYFDGTEWTTAAVDAKTTDPDELIERNWDANPPDDSSERWSQGFRKWDVDIPRGTEPPIDMRGGFAGLYANRLGRFGMRYPGGFSRVCGGLLVIGVFAAVVDPSQRPYLWVLGACLAVYVTTKVILYRRRAHWKRVGQDDTPLS